MIFFNPAELFSPNTEIPWSDAQLFQVSYSVKQNLDAFNILPNEDWFLKKIKNPTFQELYTKLAEDKPLSLFIKNGDTSFFNEQNVKNSTESSAYLRFWKPFFLKRIDLLLCSAYLDKALSQSYKLIKIPFELSPEEKCSTYQNLAFIIQESIFKIHQFELKIRKKATVNPSQLQELEALVQVSCLNALPDYFQEFRVSISKKLVEIAMQIFNKEGNNSIAEELIFLAKQLNIPKYEREKLNTWHTTLRGCIQNGNTIIEYSDVIQDHTKKLQSLEYLMLETQEKSISAKLLKIKTSPHLSFIGIEKLPNSLKFFIKDYLHYLRIFAAYSWNEFQDINRSMFFLDQATRLPLNPGQKITLSNDYKNLETRNQDLINDIKKLQNTYERQISIDNEKIWPRYFLGAIFVGIIGALLGNLAVLSDTSNPGISATSEQSNTTSSNSSDNVPFFPRTSNSDASDEPNAQENSSSNPVAVKKQDENQLPIDNSNPRVAETDQVSSITEDKSIPQPESLPEVNAANPQTGERPYEGTLGNSEYSDIHENWIEINNNSSQDLVIFLVDFLSKKLIRHTYIRSGDSYTMRKITTGDYEIFIQFGRKWDPKLNIISKSIKGGFSDDPTFYSVKLPGGHLELYGIDQQLSNFRLNIIKPLQDSRLAKLSSADFISNLTGRRMQKN